MTTQPSLIRRRFIGLTGAAMGLSLPPLAPAAWAEVGAGMGAVHWRGRVLGAAAEMIVHHHDRARTERLVSRAVAEIARLERIFSLYIPGSALSTLNRLGALAAPPPELVGLLETSRLAWSLSGGAFDPTVQPLWLAYARHFATPGANPAGPPGGEVAAALALAGFDKVGFDRSRIVLAKRGMGLTLNGIAQGYITDCVIDLLGAGGASGALADIGEIRALGRRPDGSPWQVGIAGGADIIPLADRAIATSSASGFRFAGPGSPGHLLDPRSGAATSLHGTVSVLAPQAATADALATAFCLMPAERIAALLPSLTDVEVRIT